MRLISSADIVSLHNNLSPIVTVSVSDELIVLELKVILPVCPAVLIVDQLRLLPSVVKNLPVWLDCVGILVCVSAQYEFPSPSLAKN